MSFVRRGSSMGGEDRVVMSAEDLAEKEAERKVKRLRMTEGLRGFLIVHVVLGLCTMGVSIYTLSFDRVLNDFMLEFVGVLAEGFGALWNLFVLMPLFAGLGAIFVAGVALKSSTDEGLPFLSEKRTKQVFHGSLFLLLLLFLGQIAFATGYLIFLTALQDTVEQQSLGAGAVGVEGLEQDISSLQLAAFNLCCAAEGWSAQGVVPVCAADGSAPSTCGLPGSVDSFSDVLCTCYAAGGRYNEYLGKFAESGLICNILSKAVVGVSRSQNVPGSQLPLSAFVPVSSARIVGQNAPPDYGCGFGGYARAFQWMQFEYVSQSTQYIPVAMIVISLLELIVLLLLYCRKVTAAEDRFYDDIMDDIEKLRIENPGEHIGGAALAKKLGFEEKMAAAAAKQRGSKSKMEKEMDVLDGEAHKQTAQAENRRSSRGAKAVPAAPKPAGAGRISLFDPQPAPPPTDESGNLKKGLITPMTPMPQPQELPPISAFTMGDGSDGEGEDDDDEAPPLEKDPSVAF